MSYFETKLKKDCCGCEICALKCPKNAITMKQDEEGFLYPEIDYDKCVNCGLCRKICPNHDYPLNKNIESYIAINNNKKELMNSASGGMFILLAKYVINKKGVVFGVKYDENLKVVHDYSNTLDGCFKFQGSKYVRSDLNNSFLKVKEFLENNRYVLFTGTPCQCQALRTFLNKQYEKLVTCDVICHANPSPKVFEQYKNNLEKKYGKKVTNICFRSKKNGWHTQTPIIEFEDKSEIEDESYILGFVRELFNRPSCHNCHFCSSNRLSDFTIGDFWGIEKVDKSIKDDNTGISLLCVNTTSAKKILDNISSQMFLKKTDLRQAFSYNHYSNSKKSEKRNRFFKGIEKGTINAENIINVLEKYTKRNVFRKFLGNIKMNLKRIIKS